MQRFRLSEPVVIGILTVVILFLSLLPLYLKLLAAPPGRGFIPVHNSLSDYPFYTAIIKEGLAGQWRVWGRFTPEPQVRGGFVHFFYLLLGQAGRLFGTDDAQLVYHTARVIFGGMWLIIIYRFVSEFMSSRRGRLLGFFFAVFSAGWPTMVPYNGKEVLWWPMSWWSELDPVTRAAFLPHYLVGHILMAILFLLVLSLRKRPRLVAYMAVAVLGWLAGFIHPPSLIIVILVAPVWLMVTGSWRQALTVLVPLGLAATSALVIKHEFSFFPWTLSQNFEGLSFALNIREYLLALGPMLPLAVIGVVVKRKDRTGWLLVLWFVISLVMMEAVRYAPFAPFDFIRSLAISNTRFLQVAVWVPVAILGTWGILWVRQRFRTVGYGILLIALFVLTFAGYPQSIRFQSEKIFGSELFTYPTPGWLDAIASLPAVTGPDQVVWAQPLAGQIIPSYTNLTVYTGNELFYTQDLGYKMETSWGLYHGSITPCKGYTLMKQNRVKAVFYGFDEQNAAGDPEGRGDRLRALPFLLPWKKFGTTSIFLFTDVPPAGCTEPAVS